MRVKILRSLFLFCSIPVFLLGSLKNELNGFFNEFGSAANLTSEDIYMGQSAGYMTGGGLNVRNQVYNSDLVNISLPRLDGGCGGIDIFTGGFSFISKDQLVTALKSTASNAASYAFLLGVETVSPQVANAMKQAQSWANTINGIGINSCENAMGLVGSAWPKSEASSQQVCRTAGSSTGVFEDFIEGRHKCSARSKQNEVISEIQEKNPDLIIGSSNLTWESIQQQKFLAENPELSHLFMTLVGTVVLQSNDNGSKIESYPAKATDETFLQALMRGGETEVYRCVDIKNDSKCLTINKKKTTIKAEDSWYGKVSRILKDMQEKAIKDEPLNADQKDLLNKTHFPLYRMVNVLTAYKKGHAMVDLCNMADMVSKEILIEYLKEVEELVKEGMYNVRNLQVYQNPEELENFEKRLKSVREKIQEFEFKSKEELEKKKQLRELITFLEDKIASEIWLDVE